MESLDFEKCCRLVGYIVKSIFSVAATLLFVSSIFDVAIVLVLSIELISELFVLSIPV